MSPFLNFAAGGSGVLEPNSSICDSGGKPSILDSTVTRILLGSEASVLWLNDTTLLSVRLKGCPVYGVFLVIVPSSWHLVISPPPTAWLGWEYATFVSTIVAVGDFLLHAVKRTEHAATIVMSMVFKFLAIEVG